MNCQLCQKELEAYREGKLPEGTRVEVEAHLHTCNDCTESYQLIVVAEKVMAEEKGIESNPFLSTRIMAGIAELEQKHANVQSIPGYQKILKPALISISVAAAIFAGIVVGDIYSPIQKSNKIPVEMAYMNDAAIESASMFLNE